MCSSSLWRWDAAAREGPCEGHKGLADETGERVRFCGALLLDAVGTCCAAHVALLWCEPRFPDACAAGDLLKWGLPEGGIKSAKVAPTPYA